MARYLISVSAAPVSAVALATVVVAVAAIYWGNIFWPANASCILFFFQPHFPCRQKAASGNITGCLTAEKKPLDVVLLSGREWQFGRSRSQCPVERSEVGLRQAASLKR